MQENRQIFSKYGVVCSAFDLLHAGHMLMLKDARSKCKILVVFLQEDPSVTDASYRGKKKDKPIMSLKERRILIEGCKYADIIIDYTTEEDLYTRLQALGMHVRILGSDWKGKKYTGHDLNHIPYFHERNHDYSTTELKKRIYENISNNSNNKA